ncbi:NAD(P)/FAD-dependent oxidoreductase [Sphingobacterium sp. SYP-B4668]|uniref:NAD(P)/FAD-dependent oxidoreductase n=1 Tax=Sphingobacterium sp. SYP-B4668 TaxID=2996035 RepID=UPI0022DE4AD0|nr:NAD(P)/FAD-dependent oxidoreductase [Sphingobacterium sp. SYP-B4668]
MMVHNTEFDVIIIGGSYAGLSAAMALGRSLKNVLVIDSGQPCNRQTPHSHNFLTQDGNTPLEIARLAKEQVQQYSTVSFRDDLVTSGRSVDFGFEIETASGKIFNSSKLLFATGILDKMPHIQGFAECWGISVIHCPYCHGYEFRNKSTGLIANGERAAHLASLVHNLTDQLIILTSGQAEFSAEQMNRFKKHKIDIFQSKITKVIHQDGKATHLLFENDALLPFDAIYAAVPFEQQCLIPESMGCELNEQGYIKVDAHQKTTIPGIFACGDSTNMMRSVANAVSSGNIAGAMANMELTQERFS